VRTSVACAGGGRTTCVNCSGLDGAGVILSLDRQHLRRQ
jgi:hypothetical protein